MVSDSLSLVRIDHLEGPVAFLAGLGAPVERLLRRACLPSLALGDPDAFVSSRLIYRFLDLAAGADAIDDLGLRSAEGVPVGEDAWTGTALRSACTLQDALDQLVSLARRESAQMHLELRANLGQAWIEYRGSTPFEHGRGADFAEQYMLAILVRFIRCALESPWRPRTIHVQARDYRALEASELLGGARISGGKATTAILIPRPLLGVRIRRRPMHPTPGGKAPSQGFVGGLRRALAAYVAEGTPNVQVAAEMVGASVRSLQRRLSEVGLSYSQLTEQLRRERACRLVGHTDMRLVEIALELGYSDASHFTRAFRRWSGTTPSGYRREHGAVATA